MKMKSYMTSALTRAMAQMDPAAFVKAYPHAWVVWEPGAWRPPTKSTLLDIDLTHPAASGEGLALVLSARDGIGEVTLGRSEACDLVINDGTLSGKHLVFSTGPTGWTVRDAGSRNGASLNGVRLSPQTPAALKDGVKLVCGQVTLTFHTAEGLYTRLKTPSPVR